MPQPSLLNKSFLKGKDKKYSSNDFQEIGTKQADVSKGLFKSKTSLTFALTFILLIFITSLYLLYKFLFPTPYILVDSTILYNNSVTVIKEYSQIKLDEPVNFKTLNPEAITLLPEITASEYLVYDPDTYQVFVKNNSSEKHQIASLTKLMTALITIDTYELGDKIIYDGILPDDIEWTLNLEPGDTLTVEDLLNAMLMSSYNDAAYLVAKNYPDGGEDGFITEMNRRAIAYGMYDTSYANSYGFDDPDNYSSAHDLMILSSHFLQNTYLMSIVRKGGETVQIVANKGFGDSRQKIIYSTNYLLGRDSTVYGLKTGTTKGAGPCFTGYFINDDGSRNVTILLGSEGDRFKETQDLVKYVQDNFK